jgi:hemoglobin-like flavoprotein
MDIRPPDKVKREKLMSEPIDEYNDEMDEALYQSMQNVILQQKMNEDYEDELINTFTKIQSERSEKFKDLLFDVKRIANFDKNIKEIHEIIEPIIEAYCNQYIEHYNIDKETLERIFKVLSTIRTNKNSIEFLKTIIIC